MLRKVFAISNLSRSSLYDRGYGWKGDNVGREIREEEMKRMKLLSFIIMLGFLLIGGSPIFGEEVILDNLEPGASGEGISFTGTWSYSSCDGFYGTRSLYAGDYGEPADATYRFTPTLNGGTYGVYVHYTTCGHRSSEVAVKIEHASGYSLYYVNMQDRPLESAEPEDTWLYLASKIFDAGDAGYVEISAINGQACADGVKFVETDNASPEALDDSAHTRTWMPVNIYALDNDTDPDGETLKIISVTRPAYGSVKIIGRVDPSGNMAHCYLRYTPYNASDVVYEYITDSFNYTIIDEEGGKATATVIVTLHNSRHYSEVRGVWLNDHTFNTDERRTKTLQKIQEANLNTIFVAAHEFEIDGEYYHGWSNEEDFEALYQEATSRGLSIHVWVCSKFRKGYNGGQGQVDYTDPREREKQRRWCQEWLNTYPGLDGFHLDYIRYSGNDCCDIEKTEGVSATVELCHGETQTRDKFLTAAAKLNYPHNMCH